MSDFDDHAELRVERWDERATVEAHRSALIDGTKRPARRWAFVLVDVGGGVNLTKEAVQDKLFSTTNPASIASFYKEVSYGIQDLEGQIFGPLTYAPVGGACDSSGASRTLRASVPGTFDQYLWYFGSRRTACGWSGTGSLGTPDRPGRDSWYNASSGCVVLVQEPGHNFGMLHSSALRCTSGGTPVPFAVPPQESCTHNEYGNPFDPMGGGCYHMNGYQKAYQDWIGGCNVVKATTSGTFTIYPLEKACNGVQLLQVPMPSPRMYNAVTTGIPERMTMLTSYYVELRAPIGIDRGLMTPRVLVTIAGEIKDARRSGGRNWLLDMKPETTSRTDAALSVGQMFADPDPMGPKITLVSADATKAVVRVELAGGGNAESPGTGVCDDTTPFTAPGPDVCAAGPATPDGGPTADAARDVVPRDADGTPRDATADTSTPRDTTAADASAPAAPDATAVADAAPAPAEVDAGGPPSTERGVSGGCSCEVGASTPAGATTLIVVVFLCAAHVRRRVSR